MREFFKYLICVFIFCSSLNAIPIPLPVTDAKAIQQVTKLTTDVVALEALAAAHWILYDEHWREKKLHWSKDTNKFYDDARQLYQKILTALTSKDVNINLQELREKSQEIDARALELLGKRDYAELVDGSLASQYNFEILVDYCEKIEDKNRQRACYNDFGAAGIKLGTNKKANENYALLTKKIQSINDERKNSKDIKSSIDVKNAISQSFLELDLQELEKEINEIAASNKYDLEMQSATNLTLQNINNSVDMSKIPKANKK